MARRKAAPPVPPAALGWARGRRRRSVRTLQARRSGCCSRRSRPSPRCRTGPPRLVAGRIGRHPTARRSLTRRRRRGRHDRLLLRPPCSAGRRTRLVADRRDRMRPGSDRSGTAGQGQLLGSASTVVSVPRRHAPLWADRSWAGHSGLGGAGRRAADCRHRSVDAGRRTSLLRFHPVDGRVRPDVNWIDWAVRAPLRTPGRIVYRAGRAPAPAARRTGRRQR